MHYCIHLFTETLPNEKDIQRILEPYNSEKIYGFDEDGNEKKIIEYPAFTWDWWQIGGRYHGRLKLKIDENDEVYRWQFYSQEPREGRLFHSMLLRRIRERFTTWKRSEEDYFGYLGYLDKDPHIRVDGAKISDLINDFDDLGCFGFVDLDGKAYSRERWDGEQFIEDTDFDKRYQEKLKEYLDCFLTVIDIHD